MQILPLLTTSDTSSSELATSPLTTGNRQVALFASLLSTYASTSGTVPESGQTATADSNSSGSPLEASGAPSQSELMQLPVTREDIAALHDSLQERGFSDSEISELETKAAGNTGMTWGDLMTAVNKKTAEAKSAKHKDVSTDDQAQLLGLFGKLGFTADQSQQLVDALAKGNIDSVWSAVNAKIEALAGDSTVSINSSEMAALARGMSLSAGAQERLTTLFDQSTSALGLSGDGLKSAFSLVKNEHNAELVQESEGQELFRKTASAVLAQSWQRNTTSKKSGMHEDDVARKAAQVVAMGSSSGRGKKDSSGVTATSASKETQVDMLADVPETGQGVGSDAEGTEAAKTVSDGLTQMSRTESVEDQAARIGQPAETTLTAASKHADRTAAKAKLAAKSKEQAETAADAAAADAPDAAEAAQTTAATRSGEDTGIGRAAQGQEKNAAPTVAAGAATNEFTKTSGDDGAADGQSRQSGQSDQEENWGDFWSKVASEGDADTQGTTDLGRSASHNDLAATANGLKSQLGTPAKATVTPGLASRASRQLESGLLRNLGQGTKQLTLNLQPDTLGKLSVTLTVTGKEIHASITTDNSDTATMLQNQVAHIKQTLENQGFKVTKLDVQTGLAQDNQSAWQGPEQHNQAREQRESLDRFFSSQRLSQSGEGAFDASQAAVIAESMTTGAQGLDLFA